MPHYTSWNQILIKTFVSIEIDEFKQRVITGDVDPTFTLDNNEEKKMMVVAVLAKEEND